MASCRRVVPNAKEDPCAFGGGDPLCGCAAYDASRAKRDARKQPVVSDSLWPVRTGRRRSANDGWPHLAVVEIVNVRCQS